MTEEKESHNTRKLPITIEQKEVVKILRLVKQPHHKVAILLAFGSGLRISEVLNLKPEHIDYDGNKILVKQGKGSKDRYVNIPVYWDKRLDYYLPIKCGKRSLQQAFETYAERAGVRTKDRPVHFHTLRHGYATRLYINGLKLSNVQQMLGHSNINTTLIYANIMPDEIINEIKDVW